MPWSFSQYRTFQKCPRQWFYAAHWARSSATEPDRREAALLKKLQTVSAWRGGVVDTVFERFLVPRLNERNPPRLSQISAEARRLFDKQLDFARNHRIREKGMSAAVAGEAFAAFFKIEYGEAVDAAELQRARKDVIASVENLYRKMNPLRDAMRKASLSVAQSPLSFKYLGGTVRARPDLILFFEKRPPIIVDWKVHAFGNRDYADQLTGYALALTRGTPHVNFARYWKPWKPCEIELIEAQLLLGALRKHQIDEDEIAAAEERIAEGILTLQSAYDGKEPKELQPGDFPRAHRPETCLSCSYRKICWRN
jgi:hypothetical protein